MAGIKRKATKAQVLRFIIDCMINKQSASRSAKRIGMENKLADWLDELDFVEIILFLEREYGLAIPDENALEFKTFGDLVNHVIKKQER